MPELSREDRRRYKRLRQERLAVEAQPCSCGNPVWIVKTGQCQICYQVAYRERLAERRRAARADPERMVVAGAWTQGRPPAKTPAELAATRRERRRERMADPEYRQRHIARRRELAERPGVREETRRRKREWLAARMADPEQREYQLALARASYRRCKPTPKSPPTPEEREAARRQRLLDYERRLLADPQFREQALAKERERAKTAWVKRNQRRARRQRTDPEYRKALATKRHARLKERLKTDPEYAARYRAQRTKHERERRARRRAEQRREGGMQT